MFLQFVINGLVTGCLYALVAVGFSLVYRTARFFHFSHGAVLTLGVYGSFALAQILHSAPAGFFFALLICVLFGIGIDRFVHRPLRKRHATGLVHGIASLGVFLILQNSLQLVFGAESISLRTGPPSGGHVFFGLSITSTQLAVIGVTFGIVAALWIFFRVTRLGMAMRAVADDWTGASIVGVDPDKTTAFVFGLGSAIAGVAGILYGFETNVDPTTGFNVVLKGIIACIVGGLGGIWGGVVGGLVLGLSEDLAIWKLPAVWRDGLAFCVLIIFLILRPRGILGQNDK